MRGDRPAHFWSPKRRRPRYLRDILAFRLVFYHVLSPVLVTAVTQSTKASNY
jgi:hypothetical protein